MTEKFSLKTWIDEEEKRHPGFKKGLRESYGKPQRNIKSDPPVACANGKYECYVPTSGWRTDGQIYKCKTCGKKYQYIMYKWVIGQKDKSGWYLQSDSILDIIKSWFKII